MSQPLASDPDSPKSTKSEPALVTDEEHKLEVIRAAIKKAEEGDQTRTHHHQGFDTQVGRIEIHCPSCRSSVEIEADTSFTDLICSSCGSHFSLVDQSEETGLASAIAQMGRFELLERLGMGNFGTVWKARDKELDRTVAIKVPRRGGMTPEEQEKFLREARAAAQLRHPNIVSVHDVGREGDTVFIVSEFIRGVTLADWLDGHQLNSSEAAGLCAKIAEALSHAHQKKVIHRDLKPANIMMDGDGEPHVMDFGLARREEGEATFTLEGLPLGTPAYMPPEQAKGDAHNADGRSDIYSLGVILFQLLTGKLPFRGGVSMLIHQAINDEAPSPISFNANVAKDIDTITLKCLEKEPSHRYQTAQELADELHRFLQGEPIKSRPVPQIERAKRWAQRRPAVAIAICLAFFSCLAFASWFQFFSAALPQVQVKVVDASGMPLSDVQCRLIVGGYPSDSKGYPTKPSRENSLVLTTDAEGIAAFSHAKLGELSGHALYCEHPDYVEENRFFDMEDLPNGELSVKLHGPQFVTLEYLFQPNGTASFDGEEVKQGTIKLFPMESGSYRPPARAFFSLAANERRGGGGVLPSSEPGIAIDQRDGKLYFGGERGRFDHCTDLGAISFQELREVDTDVLVREREATLIKVGHTYVYESNIYDADSRTEFTGKDIKYAKILVKDISSTISPPDLKLKPEVPRAGESVKIRFRPGSNDLDGARNIQVNWIAYDQDGKIPSSITTTSEFPAESRGVESGDFRLGRRRCCVTDLKPSQDGYWECEIPLPADARSAALVFVDEIGRTSAEGIKRFDVASK